MTVAASGDAPPLRSGPRVVVHRRMREWCGFRLPRFLRLLDDAAPDVVHIHYPSRGYGWRLGVNALPLVLRLLRPRVPIVTTLHEFGGLNPLRQASFLFFTLFSKVIVTPAAPVRNGLEAVFPWVRGKTTVVPVGSFLRPAQIAAPRVAGKPLLVFPGFLLERKGPLEAVEALALLKDEFPGMRLLFASDAASHRDVRERVKRTAFDRGVADRVGFLDNLDAARLGAVMRRADLVVLPFHDGASTRRTTLVSAVALGCRVVTTEGPGTLGEFRRGGVLLARAKDTASLAGEIRRGLTDKKARSAMKKGTRRLAKLFDWGRIARAHKAIYEKAVRSQE